MPSLPRIKRPLRPRTQARDVDTRPEPRVAELQAHGLTWVHLDAPSLEESSQLAERYGWHPLDLEDVLSRRQRPKVDEYPDYLFGALHFQVYDKAIQRLNAAELDVFVGNGWLVTLPNVELLPVTRLFGPRSPRPCCTVFTCMSCQCLRNVQAMPPWRTESR